MRRRTDDDEPGAAPGHRLPQPVRQQEMAEVVGGKPDIEAVRQVRVRRFGNAGIADQRIDRSLHPSREGNDRGDVGEIEKLKPG